MLSLLSVNTPQEEKERMIRESALLARRYLLLLMAPCFDSSALTPHSAQLVSFYALGVKIFYDLTSFGWHPIHYGSHLQPASVSSRNVELMPLGRLIKYMHHRCNNKMTCSAFISSSTSKNVRDRRRRGVNMVESIPHLGTQRPVMAAIAHI